MIDLRHYDVIISPVVTEKSTLVSENNYFVFKVGQKATKLQIKAAIEALFKVKVESVNTAIRKGKVKRFKGLIGKQSDSKRAFVKLADGHSIDLSVGL